jgi:iron complex transport system substrate-binding protein
VRAGAGTCAAALEHFRVRDLAYSLYWYSGGGWGRGLRTIAAIAILALLFLGCDKNSSPPPTTSTSPKTVASLVPAATDLILGMGARDRLLAVSTYDSQRPDVANLPRVGDYQTVDWEQIQSLHPSFMVIQIRKDRLPAGFKERADALNIELVDIGIDRLNDVFTAVDTLGEKLGMQDQAKTASQQMHARLDAVSAGVAGSKPVSTLLVLDESGTAVVGPDTYLDSILQLAGGVNAAASLGQRYPEIDREMLIHLKPDVIIQLLPDASQQVKDQAAATWARLPQIPAVAAGRVYTIDSWYALLPGWHVTDLAEQFAKCLHPPIPVSSPPPTQP